MGQPGMWPTAKSARPEWNSNGYGDPMETLRVGAAFPDPPFNGMPGNAGIDIDLMTAIAEALGAAVEFVPYEGVDFNGIFDRLGVAYDCVAAGTTVTPERESKARFVAPYDRRSTGFHNRCATRQHQSADRRGTRRPWQGGAFPRL